MRLFRHSFRAQALTILGLLLAAASVSAQVSLTGGPYTQDFNTLALSGTSSTAPTGWFFSELGTAANTTYTAGTGSSATGDTYSFGAAANVDRALGGLLSGSLTPTIGAAFTNNLGSTITDLAIAYTGEQWRIGATGRVDRLDFQYSTDATSLTTGTWTNVDALDFTAPNTVGPVGPLNGNANTAAVSSTLTGLAIANGATFWIRWTDFNPSGSDDGLAVDDFSINPGGAANEPIIPTCPASLSTLSGSATSGSLSATDADGTVVSATITGITPSAPGGNISITGFTPAGSVGGTATGTLSVSDTTAVGAYNVTIEWANDDGTPQTQTCVTAVSVVGAVSIHEVQGNGSATPMPGATVSVEGVVVANFQGTGKLQGFFLQDEDADADADPATSEGIFVFCNSCPTAVAEGQRVRAIGVVSEFFNMTEITASTAGSVVITNAGNNLAQVTPTMISLPVVGSVNDFYETREGMLVTFTNTLSVSEYFELARFGHIILSEGGRPVQFTETNPPSVSGNTAHLDTLSRRQIILDDDNNGDNGYLSTADGNQALYYPTANGGFSVGTQGTDFFRGGDLVNGLTGVLHWSFAGLSGTDAWRIRPTSAHPVTFTTANPRPATPPAVGGAIKAVSMNLLNYFTTIDTTSSTSSGPCGPSGTLDCRGADSLAELDRQRERAALVICSLNADVYGFMELENTTASDTITDLLGAVNTSCGGSQPYAAVSTGGTLGTDAIRVQLVYRTGVLSPVGAPMVDLDGVHNRPPTAQTFDVVDAANPAFGERFTVIASHFKSKGCSGATGLDADSGDGQGCFAAARTDQAAALLAWITATVIPAAGDPDVLLLGDFNSYAQETPATTITSGGYVDVETALLGSSAYSYLFDGQLGHLDYAFASTSLFSQVAGIGAWHINADEVPVFDYNDEIKTTGEAAFEEKPNGSLLTPPRVVFEAATAARAADHDPILIGLFPFAPVVISPTSAMVLETTATLGGDVTSEGTAPVTERGVVYAETAANSDPSIGGTGVTKVSTAGTTGVFTVGVTGLTAPTGYSFKAYATNTVGTSYTSVATFATIVCPTIMLGSLSNGTVGVSYTGSVAASGGAAPYTYALTLGPLPGGLGLTGSGLGAGDVTSAPSVAGTFSFEITATDALGCTGIGSYEVVIGSSIAAGDLLIREFRWRGPAGTEDEYVEVFNRTSGPLTIAATDGSAGFGLVSESAGLLVTILNGTYIPAGGSWLATNSTPSTGYSLKDYGGADAAEHDASWTTDVADGSGLGLFRSTSVFDASTTRIDAVGFSGSSALFLEGTGLAPVGGITTPGQWAVARKSPYPSGVVKDTGDNLADFQFISPNAGMYDIQSALGSPGPQNLASARLVPLQITLADPVAGANAAPNKLQVGNYLYARRKVTNNTGSPITQLKLRIADVSTLYGVGYNPAVQADMRGISTVDTPITVPGPVTAKGLTLEAPSEAYSATTKGGGYQASFVVDLSGLPDGELGVGGSLYVNIGFRSVKGGNFYFVLVPEILN